MDPRHLVTPDAFEVAETLLGRPLASPWRRGMALLADLLFIFLLTRMGSASAALAASVVFFLLVTWKPIRRRWLRWMRRLLAVAGSMVLFLTVYAALSWSEVNPYTGMSMEQWMEFGALAGSQDFEGQSEALEQMITEMVENGAARSQSQAMLDSSMIPPELQESLQELITFGLEGSRPEPVVAPTDPALLAELLDDYAAALRQADEARITELAGRTEEIVGAETKARLEGRIEGLRAQIRDLYADNRDLRDQVENPSFLHLLSAVAQDLGLTFGWSGLYFTLFLGLWNGRTPGKWIFRLRVVRLDDQPLSLWGALERFAGYAAGLATGLLGFLQILWDPNRQGLQDKIVGTVVVLTPERGGKSSG